MKRIKVFTEGGGDTADQRAELRAGFHAHFDALRQAALKKRIVLEFICCGGREATHDRFLAEVEKGLSSVLPVLFVDSEDEPPEQLRQPLNESQAARVKRLEANGQSRKEFLIKREGWNLKGIAAKQIQLLGVCMEELLCADREVLANYYGKDFNSKPLPNRLNLDEEPKARIYDKLGRATKETQKGEYSEATNSKIKHGANLIGKIDPNKVSKRCPCHHSFIEELTQIIEDF